jgi:hypothetical protein
METCAEKCAEGNTQKTGERRITETITGLGYRSLTSRRRLSHSRGCSASSPKINSKHKHHSLTTTGSSGGGAPANNRVHPPDDLVDHLRRLVMRAVAAIGNRALGLLNPGIRLVTCTILAVINWCFDCRVVTPGCQTGYRPYRLSSIGVLTAK